MVEIQASALGIGFEELNGMGRLTRVSGPYVAIDVGRTGGQHAAIWTFVAVAFAAEVAQVSGDGGLLAESALTLETLVTLALVGMHEVVHRGRFLPIDVVVVPKIAF